MRPPILPRPINPILSLFMSAWFLAGGYWYQKSTSFVSGPIQRADHADQAADTQAAPPGVIRSGMKALEPVHIERIERRDDHGQTEADAEAGRAHIGDEAFVDVRDDHAPRRSHEHREHADEQR